MLSFWIIPFTGSTFEYDAMVAHTIGVLQSLAGIGCRICEKLRVESDRHMRGANKACIAEERP